MPLEPETACCKKIGHTLGLSHLDVRFEMGLAGLELEVDCVA